MTTSFLNFARPQPLQLEDVSLNELLQECVRELGPLFESRRVKLVIEGSSPAQSQPGATAAVSQQGSSPTVREGSINSNSDQQETPKIEIQADTRMLRQALLNLLRNAAEAIPKDKSVRQVTIRSSFENEQGKPWATISIQDTGDGIAPADLQKIFIPFFTTKTGGHGIGLALAHRVITEHGVTNAPQGGAVFTLRLPQ